MKRVLIGLGVTVLVIGVVAVIGFFSLGFYLSPQSKLAKVDAIVAVSGGDTAARTAEAVDLYKHDYAPKIIFSGAALDPKSVSNAQAMATLAGKAGVPASAIELDEAAMDTRQNASDVADIVRRDDYRSIILVTSPYHQRRVYTVFRQALGKNITILNHSSIDKLWRRSHWWATEYSRNLTISEAQKTLYELVTGK
ncbi:MAG: YdcF family protein [Candidatus Saccharibacteria bacterium]